MSFGLSPLPTIAARRRLLLKTPREFEAIAPMLQSIFKGLVEGHRPWPLLLFGPSGAGKTSASLALADRIETASYTTAEDLATLVMTRDAADVEYEWSRIGSKSLAILDELGCRERVGDLAYGVVKKFADLRELEAGRVAIYISNVEPRRLIDLYDDRIYSRLTCGTVLELTGPDRRRGGA